MAAHGIEQLIPEGASAEAGHDGQVEADIGDGAAYRTATHLALQFLQCGGLEVKRPACGLAGDGLSVRGCAGWCGLFVMRTNARAGEWYIAATSGAGEQHTFQRGGTQHATTQAGENYREIERAETRRDGGEPWRGGTVPDGVGEVAAVAQQNANDVEECRDALGDGSRIRGMRALTIHGRYSNIPDKREQWMFTSVVGFLGALDACFPSWPDCLAGRSAAVMPCIDLGEFCAKQECLGRVIDPQQCDDQPCRRAIA